MKALDTEAVPQGQENSSPDMSKASQEEELDLKIAVSLGHKLLKDAGGLAALDKAMKATSDPVQVVSKFLVQLIMQIKDAVAQQSVDLSPSIVLGQGGWLVQMLDLLETELGLPAEFSDGIIDDVIETFKALSQGGKGGQQPQGQPAAPQGAPAGPPAGPPMMGG